MEQERCREAMSCPVCGGSRWWRSRTGLAVCHHCHPDPLEALQVLGDQTKGEFQVPGSSPLADHGDHVGPGPAG
jgi:hypothetical protein